MEFAISQPKVVRRSDVRVYQIVTGVTSDVGLPSTHLVIPWVPFYSQGLTLTPALISYHGPCIVWDEIIHPFPKFNDAAVLVWNGYVISSHTLLSVWVLIHAALKVNSLRPSDAIWRQRTGSTLAKVMTCCLTTPSHYLNQCWLTVSTDQWRLYKGNLTRDTPAINHENQLQFAWIKFLLNLPGANGLIRVDKRDP